MKRSEEENVRKRRDRLYIIAEILEVAGEGTLKTQIMYKANLSFAQLNEYLSFLLKTDLLKVFASEEKTIYKTTRKGIRYLQNYKEIRELLKKEEGRNVENNSSPCWVKRGSQIVYVKRSSKPNEIL